jgi:uncharacterized protein (DUF1684 family)
MNNYHDQLLKWRKAMDVNLTKENSWLALAGLYWLEEGENSFGSSQANKIVFPEGSCPERIGSLWLEDGVVTLQTVAGVDVRIDGSSQSIAQLTPDTSGSPTEITLGTLRFMLIRRDDGLGIRLWDNDRSERRNFSGRQWFQVDEEYCISGDYQGYKKAHQIRLDRKNGIGFEVSVGGEVKLSLFNHHLSLIALEEDDGKLFLMFNDRTNGDQTYSAGRYLVTDPPIEGRVVVDFNKAYNPPCAFTDYATCPLPPPENRIEIPMLAGELKPKGELS